MELPWLGQLEELYRHAYTAGKTALDIHLTSDPEARSVFLQFLMAVRSSVSLLDGTELWKDFGALLDLLARPEMNSDEQLQVRDPVRLRLVSQIPTCDILKLQTLRGEVQGIAEEAWERRILSQIDVLEYISTLQISTPNVGTRRNNTGADSIAGPPSLPYFSRKRTAMLERLSEICPPRGPIAPANYDEVPVMCFVLVLQADGHSR